MKRLLIDAISTNSGRLFHTKNILINFNNQNYFQKSRCFLQKN